MSEPTQTIFERNSSESKPTSFVEEHSPVSLALNSWLQSSKLAPLSFPTLFELAGEKEPIPERSKRQIFDLVGDPRVLYHALLDDPEKFEEGLDTLLIELVNGKKKVDELDRDESELLNRAVFDFARKARPKLKLDEEKEPSRLPAAARAAMGEGDDDEPELEYRESGRHTAPFDIPASAPTFWWKK